MGERKVSVSNPLLGVLARALLAASSKMSLQAARRLGTVLARIGSVLPNQFARVSRTNIDWCFPELSGAERRRRLRRSLAATGQTSLEAGPLFSWPAERLRPLVREVENEELLDRALSRCGPGAVLLVPHIGNWEILNPYLSARVPFYALYRRPRVAELEDVLLSARERTGCTMVPATPTGLRDLFKAVRDGGLVLILPDQEPVRRSGVFAPFFGIPALTMTLVPRLLQRFGSPALLIYARRVAEGFTLHLREPPEEIYDADVEVSAAALNRGVERCVRECPDQYMWSYKRFKTRPDDELHRLQVLGDPTGVRLYQRPRLPLR